MRTGLAQEEPHFSRSKSEWYLRRQREKKHFNKGSDQLRWVLQRNQVRWLKKISWIWHTEVISEINGYHVSSFLKHVSYFNTFEIGIHLQKMVSSPFNWQFFCYINNSSSYNLWYLGFDEMWLQLSGRDRNLIGMDWKETDICSVLFSVKMIFLI